MAIELPNYMDNETIFLKNPLDYLIELAEELTNEQLQFKISTYISNQKESELDFNKNDSKVNIFEHWLLSYFKNGREEDTFRNLKVFHGVDFYPINCQSGVDDFKICNDEKEFLLFLKEFKIKMLDLNVLLRNHYLALDFELIED